VTPPWDEEGPDATPAPVAFSRRERAASEMPEREMVERAIPREASAEKK
jgi:hypothetical protein